MQLGKRAKGILKPPNWLELIEVIINTGQLLSKLMISFLFLHITKVFENNVKNYFEEFDNKPNPELVHNPNFVPNPELVPNPIPNLTLYFTLSIYGISYTLTLYRLSYTV